MRSNEGARDVPNGIKASQGTGIFSFVISVARTGSLAVDELQLLSGYHERQLGMMSRLIGPPRLLRAGSGFVLTQRG